MRTTTFARGFPRCVGAAWVLTFLCGSALPSDFDVVLDELHYHPLSGDVLEEFVELYNRGGTRVDLSGWEIDEGIRIRFPDGLSLGPKEYLLVLPEGAEPPAGAGAARIVVGYEGHLSNGGEVIALVRADGRVVSRVHYGDASPWPTRPDGLGPSLELTDPWAVPEAPASWRESRVVGGTPGAPNSPGPPGPEDLEVVLVEVGESWRYLAGTDPYPAAWRELDFQDSGWTPGPTGIGYADGDDATVLADMRNGYISFAARRVFLVAAETFGDIDALTLEIDYDDGFVAYLNGIECARNNVAGSPGSVPAHDQPAATSHDEGSVERFPLDRSLLRAGANVLAIELHNVTIGSRDASCIPRLVASLVPLWDPSDGTPLVRLNEVLGAELDAHGFVELVNLGAVGLNLGGFVLRDSRGQSAALPGETEVEPGDSVVIDGAALGLPLSTDHVTYVLSGRDATTCIDALRTRPGPTGGSGWSCGRYPDGGDAVWAMSRPTPGGANTVDPVAEVVVHEIYFHPPYVPPDGDCQRDCSDRDQWIELTNAGPVDVPLDGWRVRGGIEFDVPDGVRIPAGGYLVVAASRNRFLAAHPGFSPDRVVGDWRGALAHDADEIVLENDAGNIADRVLYGDGRPVNDEAPADGEDDRTFRGSDWPRDADGTGRTLELVHPLLDNSLGGSWAAGPSGGTPGAGNASFEAAPGPVAGDVAHRPAVPEPGEPVAVTCRITATDPASIAPVVDWQEDGGGASGTEPLEDDGLSGDGLAGDGLYGAVIPASSEGTIIAFRIRANATDDEPLAPPRPPVPPYAGADPPAYLYQVLRPEPSPGGSANYLVVMRSADLEELSGRSPSSNVLLPATCIARSARGRTTVRHVAGIRYRGSDSRARPEKSYRIEFPPERTFEGIEHLNLNGTSVDKEILAADLFRRAGVPAPLEWTVNLVFQGELSPRYVQKERIDEDFLRRFFGDASDDGNLYRAVNPPGSSPPGEGDLRYLGELPADYAPFYERRANRDDPDRSDLVELARAFDPAETPDAEFPERIDGLIDVDAWMRFLAVHACLANEGPGLHAGEGEDCFLYRVPADSPRPDAGKWLLIPWDVEDSFSSRNEPLFRPTVPAVRRLLNHPRFAPLYYANLLDLRFGAFSRLESRQRFRLMDFLFSFSTIDSIDSYITARLGFFDTNIPVSLRVGASSPESAIGCGSLIYATADVLELSGVSHASETRRVLVNGQEAAYDPVRAEWTGMASLVLGENRVTIEALDESGASFDSVDAVARRVASSPREVSGTLSGNVTWDPSGGPLLMTDDVTVPSGSRLVISEGTEVFAAPRASIIVHGSLSAEGTEERPVLFRALSCDGRWGGIAFDRTGTDDVDPTHLLRHCELEFGDNPGGFGGCIAPVDAKLLVDSCTIRFLTANAVDGTDSHVEVRSSSFLSIHEGVHCTRSTVIVLDSLFQGMIGDKDAIDFDFNGAERSRIERCVFIDGSDDGIDLGSTTVDIRDNVFYNVQDKALSLQGNGPLGAPTITGNTIVRCGTGMALKNGVEIQEGHHNTVVGNQEGINLYAKAGANDGGHATFHSMIVWDNAEDVKLDELSTVVVTYSNVSGGLWPGAGNISRDPRFRSPDEGDYALAPDSPCIGTGRDGTDMGAFPFDGVRQTFVRGDVDANGLLEVTDAIRLLGQLFQQDLPGTCADAADGNDDGSVDVSDAVFVLLHLYAGGEPPADPYPVAGVDPTPDALGCE